MFRVFLRDMQILEFLVPKATELLEKKYVLIYLRQELCTLKWQLEWISCSRFVFDPIRRTMLHLNILVASKLKSKIQSQKRRINDLYYKLHKKPFQNSCFGSKVIKIKKTSKKPDNWDISSPCKTLFLLLRCIKLNKAIKPTFIFQHLVNVIFVFSSSRYPVQNCSSLVPEKIQWSNAVSDCTFVDLLIQLYYFIGPLRLFNLSSLLQGNFHSWYKTAKCLPTPPNVPLPFDTATKKSMTRTKKIGN